MIFLITILIALVIGVVLLETLLYAIRWYELSNRIFDPAMTWAKAISEKGYKPARVFIKECWFILLYIAFYIGGSISSFIRRDNVNRFEPGELVKGKPLIILTHGLIGRSAHFWFMRRRLSRAAPNVLTFEYEAFSAPLPDLALELRDFLLRVRSKTGMTEVILVGHSLGGLLSYEYAKQFEQSGEVKAVITMGAPFRGSRLSAMGLTQTARALHPTSPLISEIVNSQPGAKLYSIYSKYDQLIMPYTNSEHPSARKNIEIDTCGHTGFFYERSVARVVLELIMEIVTPEPGPEI